MQLQRFRARPDRINHRGETIMLPFPLRWIFVIWLALTAMLPAVAASAAREAINPDHAIAQVTDRERTTQGQTATRDTAAGRKKAIEDKYAALVNECSKQISELTGNISQLDKNIVELKKNASQLEKDHQARANSAQRASGRENLQTPQIKQKELEDKLNAINKQIHKYQQEKKAQQQLIQELKSEIAKLEKERDVALSKLK